MNNKVHTVLGGSGAIGNAVLHELKSRGIEVKTVEKYKNVEGFETIKADVLDIKQITKAIEQSSHVYLCVGLPYSSDVWTRDWPIVMKNTIEACSKNNTKVIFFDNIYMYGPAPLGKDFTENYSQFPQTKKGQARKVATDLMLKAIKENKIKGVIGRSADFYGPNAVNSVFYVSFLQRMLQGKNPQLLSSVHVPHTYSYTKDNARALVMLALDESSYGEVWHLPVSKPITMEYILNTFNKKLGTNLKAGVIPKCIQKILSIFVKPIKEVQEMLYQFDYSYIMSSQKFMNKFPEFMITSYEKGIAEMVKSFRK